MDKSVYVPQHPRVYAHVYTAGMPLPGTDNDIDLEIYSYNTAWIITNQGPGNRIADEIYNVPLGDDVELEPDLSGPDPGHYWNTQNDGGIWAVDHPDIDYHEYSGDESVSITSTAGGEIVVRLWQDLPDWVAIRPPGWMMDIVSLDFCNTNYNITNHLTVAKWQGSFAPGPTVRANFIDFLPDPDRFFVRVHNAAKKGAGTIPIQLSTDSPSINYDDNATVINLTENPVNSGIFESLSQMLMSDTVDDGHPADGITDNDTNDRTHLVSIGQPPNGSERGSNVKIEYEPVSGIQLYNGISVPMHSKTKTVHVDIVILRETAGGAPVITQANVENQWNIAVERYAQVSVTLTYSISIQDPPTGVNLNDGISATAWTNDRLVNQELRNLINGLGTGNNNTDFHAFYVNELYWRWGPNPPPGQDADPLYGVAIADYWFDESEEGYLYNIIIDRSTIPNNKLFTVPHELAHCLADTFHHTDEWNILYTPTSTSNTVTSTKRFDETQGGRVYDNQHSR
ncbi:hypothetical protein HY772_03840 [Candidatus Woesearchaeota archaeon]|nr:hypothetical protein [Candidatus Woesearchaeota archaeon]